MLLPLTAVLWLRIGLAMYHGGLSRSKNAATTFLRAFGEIAIGLLAFWAVGAFFFSFGDISLFYGDWHHLFDADGSLSDNDLFTVLLSLIPAAIVTGALLERARGMVWVVSAILMTAVVAPLSHAVSHTSWIRHHGWIDTAGAINIHFAGGVAALVAAALVGPRIGKYNRDGSVNHMLGHSVILSALGVLIVAGFWSVYIGACGTSAAIPTLFNVLLAMSAATCAAMLYSHLRYQHVSAEILFAGVLGGLVSMTAGASRMPTHWAVLTGAIAGLLVPYTARKLETRWKIDDCASSVAIHGVGGLWAALAAALFCPGDITVCTNRLMGLAASVAGVTLVAVGLPLLVLGVLKSFVMLRVSEHDELDGLDLAEHDLNAFPDFQQTTIKSYHLREM